MEALAGSPKAKWKLSPSAGRMMGKCDPARMARKRGATPEPRGAGSALGRRNLKRRLINLDYILF